MEWVGVMPKEIWGSFIKRRTKMTRRALVLSGGGAKGSFQIGAMEELILNRGLDFEILCGVSVGALNASFLAQAPFDPIHKVLKKVRFAPIIEIKPEK